MEGFEAPHRLGDLFDETVILLNDVVQIFHLDNVDQRPPAKNEQEKVEVLHPCIIGAALVDHHLLRHAVIADGLLEKSLGGGLVTLLTGCSWVLAILEDYGLRKYSHIGGPLGNLMGRPVQKKSKIQQ